MVREHRGSPWKHAIAAGIGGVLTIGGIYALAVMDAPDPGKASLVIMLFAAIAIGFIVLAVRDARARLYLHDRGIVYERGGKKTVVRYAEVASVHERRFNDKPAQLILQLRTGARVEIPTTIEAYEHAAQTIANAV